MEYVRGNGHAQRRRLRVGRTPVSDETSEDTMSLETKYLGLKLRNPIVASAGPLQQTLAGGCDDRVAELQPQVLGLQAHCVLTRLVTYWRASDAKSAALRVAISSYVLHRWFTFC